MNIININKEEEIGQIEEGKESEEEATEVARLAWGRKGYRAPESAKRLSARGGFVVDVLFRVRRLTEKQLGTLCGLSSNSDGARVFRRRLCALGFVSVEDVFCDGSQIVLRLTESGHRLAAARNGFAHVAGSRDDVHPDFLQHLLKGSELFVQSVCAQVEDWTGAQSTMHRFSWQSSNDGAAFFWKEPTPRGDPAIRKVTPDVTIDVEGKRVFVEVERSTKTLGVVFRKIEQYADLFSPANVVGAQTAYQQKYPDGKAVEVWWVFDSEERAENVREHIEDQRHKAIKLLPPMTTGTTSTIRERLHALAKVPIRPSAGVAQEGLKSLFREFFQHAIYSPHFSSRHWPDNWRATGAAVFEPAQWQQMERELAAHQRESFEKHRARESGNARGRQ